MTSRLLHLVRHGEVHNPEGILYGRLPGFSLSARGRRMAEAAAAALAEEGRELCRLVASPLTRTQESAAPIAAHFGLPVQLDERAIEPTNAFEGQVRTGLRSGFLRPRNWLLLRNPRLPSWGEPYTQIAERMLAAMHAAVDEAESAGSGDAVIVSHQSPIWLAHLAVAGERLWHNPATRRCSLSSITTFARDPQASTGFVEVAYRSPADLLLGEATDVGAV